MAPERRGAAVLPAWQTPFSLLVLFACLASAQTVIHPVNNFCSRWQHSSVVKNGFLYINGGALSYQGVAGSNDTYHVMGPTNYLVTVDMRNTWDWKSNISITAELKSKNAKTGTYPPSFQRGTIFHGPDDGGAYYTYGGRTFNGNTSFVDYIAPDTDRYALWSYNTSMNSGDGNIWAQYDVSSGNRPNYGAAAEAIDQGLGFYLNGEIDGGTSSSTQSLGQETILLDGMLVIDLAQRTSKNISTSSLGNGRPRIGGGLQYVADIGSKGILVTLGGLQRPSREATEANTGSLISFNTVDIFDISSLSDSSGGRWYTQSTSGDDIPAPRTDFCNVVMSAPDNSSHNIYMYGGWNPLNRTILDDMYVLSIPSFTWTKVWQGTSPRWGHTCHVVGNRQLLTVSGNTNPVLNRTCDWESKGVAVFDLSTKDWGSVFDAYAAPYTVTSDVVSVIGGTAYGNATLRAPVNGYSNSELQALINTKRVWPSGGSSPSQGNSTTNSESKTPVGAIAGGVVGGVVVVAALLAGLFFLRRRKQQKEQVHEVGDNQAFQLADQEEKAKHELAAAAKPNELEGFHGLAEAPPDSTTYAAELPSTNIVQGGYHGVPVIQTSESTSPYVPAPPYQIPQEDPVELDSTELARRREEEEKRRSGNFF